FRGNDAEMQGGAIYATSAGPLLENCEFENNEAYGFGAAVYMLDSGETIIKGCSFVDNRTTYPSDGGGGAIFAYRASAAAMSILIQDCVFQQNSGSEGGAVVVGDAAGQQLPVKMDNCTFEGNTADIAGALLADSCGMLDIYDCTFAGNTAYDAGGAVFTQGCQEVRFLNSTLTGNTSTASWGGGLYISQEDGVDPSLSMVNCLIAGNLAGQSAGGLWVQSGDFRLTNSLIVGNTSPEGTAAGVGGIRCDSPRTVKINNCTFTENSGSFSGGLYASGVREGVELHNSILWGNTPNQMMFGEGDYVRVGYCDVQGGLSPGWKDIGGNIDRDPLFENVNIQRPWSANDYHLGATSPCIDSGSDLLVASDERDLDNDGNHSEYVPFDLEGGFRIADSRDVEDTGVPDLPVYPEVVDMGAYEMAAFCIGEELPPPPDIASRVDYAETAVEGGINPPTAAFYHACIPSAPGGTDCARSAIIAAEERTAVTIVWKYKNNPEDWEYQEWPMTYRTGRCVAESPAAYVVASTKFFKSYPEAMVTLEDYYDVTVHLNGVISDNATVTDDGEVQPGNPDFSILASGEVHVAATCPDGRVVLQYDQYEGGPLVGLEVVEVTSEGAELYVGLLVDGSVPIGRMLTAPFAAPCRAVVIRNTEEEGIPVAWNRPAQQTGNDIYPIRPEPNSHKLIVGWYERSPLQNCWPNVVYRYTTNWPTDPQLHVVYENAEQGQIPAGSKVDLRNDLYCRVEVMYQQPYVDEAPPPYGHVTADGKFAARNPGYSVVRFDKQPDEISDCGDWVTFEVIESYDREDSMVLAPADVSVTWPIGTQLDCTELNCGCIGESCDGYFDEEAETYPYGFLFLPDWQTSPPYAVAVYDETGQIFPVNSSTEHGVLEAWWCKEGIYATGIYWPNKVATYDCVWNCDSAKEIVIASRQGANGYPDDVPEGYPPGSQVYSVGLPGDPEFDMPGWNPNDEHAILLPVGGALKAFAVRDDDNWSVQTGHPYVLVQYPDPEDEALWGMGAHCVVAESPPYDFYYDAYPIFDENCGCGDDGRCYGGWSDGAACTISTDCACSTELPVVAGQPVEPLFPVNFGAAVCMDDQDPPEPKSWMEPVTGDALWVDGKGGLWAVEDWDEPERNDCEADPDSPACLHSTANIFIWENWPGDFGCQPWLTNGPGGVGGDGVTPWPVTYDPNWPLVDPNPNVNVITDPCTYPDEPTCAPMRHIGARFDKSGECGSIGLLHDTVGVRILDPTYEVSVPYGTPLTDHFFAPLPPHLSNGEIGGGGEWPDRIWFDFVTNKLVFRGVMSDRDQEILLELSTDTEWETAINDLYALSRVQIGDFGLGEDIGYCEEGSHDGEPCRTGADCSGGTCVPFEATDGKFVSLAHWEAVEGWVTMNVQNDQACIDAGLPVSLEVWRVECPPDKGYIQNIVPQCPLSEKQVLQHSGDGGGKPELLYYQWQWSIDYDSFAPELATWQDYPAPTEYVDGQGLREVVIEGASPFTLQDTYWRVRYRGYYVGCPCTEDVDCNEGDGVYDDWAPLLGGQGSQISDWSDVQLAEGWVKRVIRGINPFDQRVEDFHVNEAVTYVDMIRQAGKRYLDPVPLNCTPDNINQVGLIELYETVLRRARSFSIDQGISTDGIIAAILLVTGKIAELNMLLGNEAYADALDPTIGVFADQGSPSGSYDPHAMFCFEEQVASMLEEELALLRGRAMTRPPDHDADGTVIATVDNRLPWNFTSGNGQVAYANNYQLTDIEEAVVAYPQGHGDAWGYYLTAVKKFYALLRHDVFDWVNTTEDVLVAGQPVPVGFMYERKFATAAASRARVGAGVTSLTFRQRYTTDAMDQQQGYPDTDVDRAWGVADWGRRAGQSAYLDWVVANAMLPAEDTDHEGIQKIDRTTVAELREIPAYHTEIQAIMDKADAGLNPLGLATNVVPFGLDPRELEEDGITHFDQVLRRAVTALGNASVAFDYANANTQRLRSMQDNLDDFEDIVEERELDYTGRLIEIFGRPYAEDIGYGGAYPSGYDGPDIFHFSYMDDSVLLDADNMSLNPTTGVRTVSVTFEDPDFSVLGEVGDTLEDLHEWTVDFHVSTDGLRLVKPETWDSRPEPGEIQFVRAELLQGVARYEQALLNYELSIDQIEDQVYLLRDLYDLNDDVLAAMIAGRDEQLRLNTLITDARSTADTSRTAARIASRIAEAGAEALPTVFLAGLASGGDFTSIPRSALWTAGVIASEITGGIADSAENDAISYQNEKELVALNQEITITGLQATYQESQQALALKQMIRSLAAAHLELHTLEEVIHQATGRYHAAVGSGVRLLEQRTAFRYRTADEISEHRYRDMAFRVFRNDAVQKYRAQFDLAARYAFLTAKAYDYETNLLDGSSLSGRHFLQSLVRERSLGVVNGGIPLVGNGLAGDLAEMAANFDVLRTELGINSRDRFQRTFSLRWELYRIPNSVSYDHLWRDTLTSSVIADLNALDVYQLHCQPLLPVRENEPAIVIPFGTTVSHGLNLFGWDSVGDEILPADRYAIKIHSVRVGLAQSYASPPLNRAVHAYLVPTGMDIMRVPTDGSIREWTVLDQGLPVPFPISESELQQPDWMPWDTLVGGSAEMVYRHRTPTLTARPVTDETVDLSYKLTGRSIWNSQWYLIIPGSELMGEDPVQGIDLLINGENGTGVRDIKLTFECYGYSGDVQPGD
ncbi:MAG: right-handed parallel beta-helix repeat-containing protein, partial [Phycisphaerae bacterium]